MSEDNVETGPVRDFDCTAVANTPRQAVSPGQRYPQDHSTQQLQKAHRGGTHTRQVKVETHELGVHAISENLFGLN